MDLIRFLQKKIVRVELLQDFIRKTSLEKASIPLISFEREYLLALRVKVNHFMLIPKFNPNKEEEPKVFLSN